MPCLRSLVVIACILVLAACSSQEVTIDSDYAIGHDFSAYKIYRWYDEVYQTKAAEFNAQNDSHKRIRGNIKDYLAERGFAHGEHVTPDFLVNFSVSRKDQLQISHFHDDYDGGPFGSVGTGTHGSHMMVGFSTGGNSGVKTYKEGTLVIDVIDVKTQTVVWRGIAEGRLPGSVGLAERSNIARQAVRDVLQQFPPKE